MSFTIAADESTEGSYLLGAVIVGNSDVAAVRRKVADLGNLYHGWRHMSRQGDPARIKITAAIAAMPVRCLVFDAGRKDAGTDRQRRNACFAGLIDEIADTVAGEVRLVIDDCASMRRLDEIALGELKRKHQLERLNFGHIPEEQEGLILVADAVAWCMAKGGQWMTRLGSVAERRLVEP